MPVKTSDKVLAWGSEHIDPNALAQAETISKLPFVKDHVALMPDAHIGKGSTVGSVIATKGAIIPAAVGVDLGCLDLDSEILTPTGWIKISQWDNEDILIYDPDSDKAKFSSPQSYIVKDCDSFYHFKNSKGLDQMLSEEHRMAVWSGFKNRGYNFQVMKPKELMGKNLDKGYYSFKTAFHSDNPGLNISDEIIRIEIMVQADGRVRRTGNGNYVELHLKKERKIERVRLLLDEANFEYKESLSKDGSTFISFRAGDFCDKNLQKYWKANSYQLSIIAEEALKWDGHIGYRSYYSSTDKDSVDIIQYAFAGTGTRASIHSRMDTRGDWAELHAVTVTRNTMVGYTQPDIVPSPDGKKYCFVVDSGFFVARRNGHIFITGNCGMLSYKLNIAAKDLPELDDLMGPIEKAIPAGMGQGHKGDPAIHVLKAMGGLWQGSPITYKLESKAISQCGTLGSGNHFFEISLDEEDNVWFVLHSGSRGIGNMLASKHIGGAKQLMQQYFIELEDLDLAYFVEGTAEFKNYILDMLWAQQYAELNREVMADNAFKAIKNYMLEKTNISIEIIEKINCHHNFTQKENHGNKNLWVTRKGAIQARSGDRAVIPGSMSTSTFIVTGKGSKASFESCSHGAGRKHSRTAAKKNYTESDLIKLMKGKVWNKDKAKSLVDEISGAYKDIDTVMDAQKDLVTIDHKLTQIFNYKG